jgi:hypothetical protein
MVGAINRDILLCCFGFHALNGKPKAGCVGMLRCTRRHEYNSRCPHTVVYNWTAAPGEKGDE